MTPDRWLKEGDKVTVGGLDFEILECPATRRARSCSSTTRNRFCFMGDVLFQGSIGRTDFPHGDHATLLASIRDKLLPLGDDVAFCRATAPPARSARSAAAIRFWSSRGNRPPWLRLS